MPVDPNIRIIIEGTVKERFTPDDIVDIVITKDEDIDGESIFTVKVVLSDRADLAKFGNRLSGLIRHLRTKLGEADESSFPIVRMMHKKDAELT